MGRGQTTNNLEERAGFPDAMQCQHDLRISYQGIEQNAGWVQGALQT